MPDAIPFTRGVPAADLIPVDDMREATRRALDADATVAPTNADALARQWANVHGLAPEPTRVAAATGGVRHEVWTDAADAVVVERACGRLPQLDGPPARLHGDLWSGNVLWSADGAWLIDPAAHGGHRETDLAMLALFGCPHLDAVLGAYDEAAPLADGWRERVPLHQLFPLLVHAALFGGGYGAQAAAAAATV